MAMIQSFPTGSGNGTSKISQKLGNAATNITGSTNPAEDGLYVEDLSTIVNSISLSQKTVNSELEYFSAVGTQGSITLPTSTDYNFFPHLDIIKTNLDSSRYTTQYITLKAGKTYQLSFETLKSTDSAKGVSYHIVDSLGNKIGNRGYTGGGYGDSMVDVVYTPTSDVKINPMLVTKNQTSTSKYFPECSFFIVKEINRTITVDPVAYLSKDGNLEETPVGSIISYTGNKVPAHYLLCNGSEYNIADYPELAKHFKDDLGAVNYFGGDGITTFAVPGKPIDASVLKLNPTMTSNTTPEGQVIYNNLFRDFRPYMAFGDSNNPSEKDCYVAQAKPSYLGYKFANPTVITAYSLQPRGFLDMNTISGTPSDWELQASNDMTNWVTLDTQSGITWTSTSDVQTFYFNNTTAYQAYRIYATNSANKDSFIIIGNLKFGATKIKEASYIKYETTHKVFFGDQTTYKVSVPFTRKSGSTFQDIIFDNANAEDDISMLGTNKLIAPMDGYYAISYFTKQFSGNAGIYDTSIYVDGVNVSSDTGSLSTGTGIASTSSIVIKLKKNQEVTFTIWSQYNIPQINGTITMALVNTLNENKVLELMNKPNLWVVGQEYDFGDGVYGQRFTGSVTHTATHTAQDVVLTSTIPDSLISSGGKWNRGSTYWTLPIGQTTPVAISTNGDIDLLSAIAIDPTRGLLVRFYNNVAQTSTYDIWVKYTK